MPKQPLNLNSYMKKILFMLAGCLMLSAMSYAGPPVDDVGDDTTITVNDVNYDNSFDAAVPVTVEYTAVNSDTTYTGVYYVSNATGFINRVHSYELASPSIQMDRAGNNSTTNVTDSISNFGYTIGGYNLKFSI